MNAGEVASAAQRAASSFSRAPAYAAKTIAVNSSWATDKACVLTEELHQLKMGRSPSAMVGPPPSIGKLTAIGFPVVAFTGQVVCALVGCGGGADAERAAYEKELAVERSMERSNLYRSSEVQDDDAGPSARQPGEQRTTESFDRQETQAQEPQPSPADVPRDRYKRTSLWALEFRLGGFYGVNAQDDNVALPMIGFHAGLEPWIGSTPVGFHITGGAEGGFLVGAKGGLTPGLSGEIGPQISLSPSSGVDRQRGSVLFLSWAPRALYSLSMCECTGPDGKRGPNGQVASPMGAELAIKFDGTIEIPVWFLRTQDGTNFYGVSLGLRGYP